MTQAAPLAAQRPSAELVAQIQAFYAHQMPLLEERSFEAFGATFTEDAEFTYNDMPTSVGREALIAGMNAAIPLNYGERIFRHWFDMMRIEPVDAREIRVTYRALVSITAEDGTVSFEPSSTVHDVLVLQDGVLYTRSRSVKHDLTDPAAYWARRAASA